MGLFAEWLRYESQASWCGLALRKEFGYGKGNCVSSAGYGQLCYCSHYGDSMVVVREKTSCYSGIEYQILLLLHHTVIAMNPSVCAVGIYRYYIAHPTTVQPSPEPP